jgi:hypothetical protein
MTSRGEEFVPLYARAGEDGESEFSRLYSGVPAWMRESLWQWLYPRICNQKSIGGETYLEPNVPSIRELERICHIDIKWAGAGADYTDRIQGAQALRSVLYAKEMRFLTAVDLHLSRGQNESIVNNLQIILT